MKNILIFILVLGVLAVFLEWTMRMDELRAQSVKAYEECLAREHKVSVGQVKEVYGEFIECEL